MMAERWHYSGDRDLAAGGVFVNLDPDDWRYGYVSAVEVTDLASACGADRMVLIERRTVVGVTDRARIAQAVEACGWHEWNRTAGTAERFAAFARNVPADVRRLAIAEALLRYGHSDPEGHEPPEVIQGDPVEPWTCDGWTATRCVRDDDLPGYVRARYLDGAPCVGAPDYYDTADLRAHARKGA